MTSLPTPGVGARGDSATPFDDPRLRPQRHTSRNTGRITVGVGLALALFGIFLLEEPTAQLAAMVTLLVWFTAPTIRKGVSGHSETTPTRAWATGVLLVGGAAILGGASTPDAARAAGVSGLLWMFGVWMSRRAIAAFRRRGHLQTSTLIVGTGEVGVSLAESLLAHPHFGLRPVGYVDHREPRTSSTIPLLGPPQDLPTILLRLGVRHVILAYGSANEADLVPVLRDLSSLPHQVTVLSLPRLYELAEPRDGDVWGYPLVPIHIHDASARPWHLKRAFDFGVAALLLTAAAPVMLALTFLIRLESPGPVLFSQTRIGQWGRPFKILKFRSMRDGSAASESWTAPEDLITRVGKVMRPTHLDELPQLINVLRGEMSIVGPRPERPEYVSEFEVSIPRYEDRHRVPVGITGWAQVNGLWGDTSMDDRARFDNRYIERWTLALDARILLRTIATLAGGRDDDQDSPNS